jgi:hypothetical protein
MSDAVIVAIIALCSTNIVVAIGAAMRLGSRLTALETRLEPLKGLDARVVTLEVKVASLETTIRSAA